VSTHDDNWLYLQQLEYPNFTYRSSHKMTDSIRSGTLTVSGHGIRLRVNRGHLEIDDGAGRHRRTLRFPRVSPELKRIVILGSSGSVTLDAFRWIQDTAVTLVQIGHENQLIAATAPRVRSHSELIRAQALAQVNGAALELSRDLICGKIAGQLAVLRQIPKSHPQQYVLKQLVDGCAEAKSGSDLLTIEAKAANEYWSAWERIPVKFSHRDSGAIPEHWNFFGSRGSPLSKNAQNAANPANAMLNYLYAILRAETRLAITTLGMEPGLSVFHSTRRWRDSFSYDLMEPLRPFVDRWLLDLLEEREFQRSSFFETRRGIVRVLPPVAAMLSETAATWREALGPLVENTARELMAWADGGNRGALTRRTGNTSDGSILPTNLSSEYRKNGRPKAQRRRAKSAREGWTENQRWEQANVESEVEVDYEDEILPKLKHLRLSEIQDATGLSMSYAAALRSGREAPHRRHWVPLMRLIAEKEERIAADEALADRWTETDFERDIRPGLEHLSVSAIAETLEISRSYAARIRRGAQTPPPKHWSKLSRLAKRPC
jgi:CRISPR-associated endonuclease Cas1